MTKAWKTFTAHRDGAPPWTFDPNTWTIVRENGVAAIMTQDGLLIDEPEDTGQSDRALIRWGIIWCIKTGDDDLSGLFG